MLKKIFPMTVLAFLTACNDDCSSASNEPFEPQKEVEKDTVEIDVGEVESATSFDMKDKHCKLSAESPASEIGVLYNYSGEAKTANVVVNIEYEADVSKEAAAEFCRNLAEKMKFAGSDCVEKSDEGKIGFSVSFEKTGLDGMAQTDYLRFVCGKTN